MPSAMLDYTKEILNKVSFDAQLFARELAKAVQILQPHELDELKEFIMVLCRQNPQLRPSLVHIQ
ncbi:MAG: hypothetical protein L0J45_05295 [Psychroflexus sp.]|nr:hypothetical protein [Psychroflexus sp.]MDN6310165.1 hypothetical protein [Psychroflexus sp.]